LPSIYKALGPISSTQKKKEFWLLENVGEPLFLGPSNILVILFHKNAFFFYIEAIGKALQMVNSGSGPCLGSWGEQLRNFGPALQSDICCSQGLHAE
jgi:hypothetical protein